MLLHYPASQIYGYEFLHFVWLHHITGMHIVMENISALHSFHSSAAPCCLLYEHMLVFTPSELHAGSESAAAVDWLKGLFHLHH